MPFSSVFPFAQILKSPLANTIVSGGTSYKCVFNKRNISEELNTENFLITAEVTTATGLLIADNATVTFGSVSYLVSHREQSQYGTTILYLSTADMSVSDPTVGSELLPASVVNFTSVQWSVYNGATKAENLATLPAEAAYTPAIIQYGNYVSLDEGSTYRLQIDVITLDNGTLGISEQDDYNFGFWLKSAGVHNLYFEAKYYFTGYIKLSGLNNTTPIEIRSISLKKVL